MDGKDAAIVSDLASRFSRIERLIVSLHYADGLTLAEVAAVLRRPEAEVVRIMGAVVERVRQSMAQLAAG